MPENFGGQVCSLEESQFRGDNTSSSSNDDIHKRASELVKGSYGVNSDSP